MAARVLYVTEKFPWPVDDGGQIRAWRILRALAREHPLCVLGLAPPKPADLEPVRALGCEVVTFPRPRGLGRKLYGALAATVGPRPYPLDKNASRPLFAELRARIARGEALALHLNQIDTAQYLERLPRAGRPFALFETQNLLTTMYRRFAETAPDPVRRAWLGLQARKMRRVEERLMRLADRSTVCSDLERELASSWGVSAVTVAENGVDTERFAPLAGARPARPGEHRPTLVFTGAMSYHPNREGFEWFLERVAPLLRERLGPFRLLVVGKDPPPALLARAGTDGMGGELDFTGWVEDVREPMRTADLFVVPLRIGGGTRIKILEAMALGLPVVSTRIGAEGLALRDGEELLLADEPAAFAAALESLWKSPEQRARLSAAGRAAVLARYDWNATLEPLLACYREALGGGNARG